MRRYSATTRRNWLVNCTAGTLGGVSLLSVAPHALLARAQEHTTRPRHRLSLAAYSYRNLLSGSSPKLTLFDFVDDCIKFGLEGTELTSYYFPEKVTNEYLMKLKRHCFRTGIDISGTAVGNDFGFPESGKRETQIDTLKGWIEKASLLGAPVIRIFAGHQKPGTDAESAHRLMVTAMEECCDHAGKYGVTLALENHGGPTATAEGLLRFVNDIQSPWFGVNLDTGNFHSQDVYKDLAKVAPHAVNVQVKVVIAPKGQPRQPTDFRRLAAILNEVGYSGYTVLEYEEKGDPREECPRYLDQMREAFAST